MNGTTGYHGGFDTEVFKTSNWPMLKLKGVGLHQDKDILQQMSVKNKTNTHTHTFVFLSS